MEIEKEVLELIKIFKKDSNLNYLTFSETKSIIYDKFSINWVYDPSRNHFVPRILKVTPAIDTIENFKIQFQIDISSQFSGLEFIVIHRVKFGSDYFNF